ncbi:MAG TPA: efflux RND transporter permease subunit, partial [Terriglobales bacterium]
MWAGYAARIVGTHSFRNFAVLGELVHRIFLEATQTAQFANHHHHCSATLHRATTSKYSPVSHPKLPAGYSFQWSGESQFEQRVKQRLKLILPIVFSAILLLLYMVFHSVAEALVLIFPTIYAMSGGLLLQWLLHYNFSVEVAVGYIALFGIAVETGVVMVVYLHEALQHRIESGQLKS